MALRSDVGHWYKGEVLVENDTGRIDNEKFDTERPPDHHMAEQPGQKQAKEENRSTSSPAVCRWLALMLLLPHKFFPSCRHKKSVFGPSWLDACQGICTCQSSERGTVVRSKTPCRAPLLGL